MKHANAPFLFVSQAPEEPAASSAADATAPAADTTDATAPPPETAPTAEATESAADSVAPEEEKAEAEAEAEPEAEAEAMDADEAPAHSADDYMAEGIDPAVLGPLQPARYPMDMLSACLRVRGQKRVCVPVRGLKFLDFCRNFHLPTGGKLRRLLVWPGGWVL